ncbi:acetyl-CoA carboxylase biotin carboxylase subunit [Bordetella petrii]|uniref:acetyl-CoA carboxylase biotin carboxylase subunit n=1 Tax=Bordetella petrii TaxID=94624 RepID=UPI001E57BE81|nr:biotin carboxylase N-terminal domain-containing protein [Bordetella petrii]MCD0501683.1 ATP-grasp domain-containing protein [Bordetella petrii]
MKKVLVANRGAVASRVIRALDKLGMQSVAIYSDADAGLPYVGQATQALRIGGPSAQESYLDQDAILRAAIDQGCDGIHPGYGFLSENAAFARSVEASGLVFVGPSAHWIALLGDKIRAREYLQPHGMPMLRSSEELNSLQDLEQAVEQIGLPLLLKPSGGGGGIGMAPIHARDQLAAAWERSSSISAKAFGASSLYAEQLAVHPRHIEFQFLADRHGNVRCLFERDCSVQRRHQKVIEEAPAAAIPADTLQAITTRLEQIMAEVGYDVIGTVEMLYDGEHGFNFLEVNTRLQVEHAVTEEITGIDIVAAQIRLAYGQRLDQVLPADVARQGHAIEARVYAEDPVRFFPSCGVLEAFEFPVRPDIRVEPSYGPGNRVTPYYDPLLAKVIARGPDRAACIASLREALSGAQVQGVKTNIPFVLQVLDDPDFLANRYSTDKH